MSDIFFFFLLGKALGASFTQLVKKRDVRR